MTESSPSTELQRRAERLMERFPTELAKACYVKDQIGYSVTDAPLPKAPKPYEGQNPLLAPRLRPPHIGAVTVTKPSARLKAGVAGDAEVQFCVDVKSSYWDLLNENGKDGELFNALLSIEVVEKKDGSLRYGVFKAGQAYHDAAIRLFGTWIDDVIDPRTIPLKAPPTPEELAKEQAAERMACRPDAMVVTSNPED